MKKVFLSIAILSAFTLSVGGAFLITKTLKDNTSNTLPPLVTASDSTPINPSKSENEESLDIKPVNAPKEEALKETAEENTSEKPTEKIITESQATPSIEKMTSTEFEQLLIKGTVSRNKRIATFVNIRTSGYKEGDRPLDNGDLMGVSQKILNDQWKSVRVISVGYDEKNRINSVVIRPIYPEEQQERQPSEEPTENVSE